MRADQIGEVIQFFLHRRKEQDKFRITDLGDIGIDRGVGRKGSDLRRHRRRGIEHMDKCQSLKIELFQEWIHTWTGF